MSIPNTKASLFCGLCAVIQFLFAIYEGTIAHHYDAATYLCCSAIFLLILAKF